VIYLYGIAPAGTRPEGEGHGGAPLDVVAHGGLVAVVSHHEALDVHPAPDVLWCHESVVERVLEGTGAVLPARFGSTFAREELLVDELARHADALRHALDRVRGSVELGLRAFWDADPGGSAEGPPADAPTTGRGYLLARAGDERRRQARRERAAALADAVHGPLAARSAEATVELLAAPRIPVTAAYLVPRDDVDGFRSQVDDLATAHPDVALVCTGPWPPYSFTPSLAPGLVDV
jgi:hypothetical protein